MEALLNDFVEGVARMRELDAVTIEVVRLRGAEAHDCRLCRSLREGHTLDEAVRRTHIARSRISNRLTG